MPERVFLDWSTPLLHSIAERILPEKGHGPLDLGHLLILTPTKQAGRRLREYLVTGWRKRGGTALLSMNVHPPSYLFQQDQSASVAHAFDWLSAWQETLTGVQPGTLPALMPQQKDPFNPAVALEFGQRLQNLREELLDAGWDLFSVAKSPMLKSEQARWQDLAKLEETYRQHLHALGLRDPIDCKGENLASYEPEPNIKKIILAGMPDPSPVILRRLQRLDHNRSFSIEVWIHAPASEASFFDEWGLPQSDWQTRHLGYASEPEGWIEYLSDPSALCLRMQEILEESPAQPDLAFGVLDDELALPLQHSMEACGRRLYYPKPVKLSESPMFRLLNRLQEHRTLQDPVSLRELWREPDLLRALQPEAPLSLLETWEKYASTHYPENLNQPLLASAPDALRLAWEKLKKWVGTDDAKGLLTLLEDIYRGRELNPDIPSERYQLRQVNKIADILQEAARRQEEGRGPPVAVLLQILKNESIDPPRIEGTLTAEGWLELAYHPAPALLLTGFQEGKVPAVNKPDPFLPNQLREELGLKSDRDWLARDAYLFHCMLMSRAPDKVRIWVLKRDREGGPLLPSRLLFACADDRMLARCELLFREPPPPPLQAAPAANLLLNPGEKTAYQSNQLSVSAINVYLECPTRFYFRYVLGLCCRDDCDVEPGADTFGTLIHRVLDKVVKLRPADIGDWQKACGEQLDHQLHERFGRELSMPLHVFRHSALARLYAAGPIQFAEWEAGWEVMDTEQNFVRDILGFHISGTIDRIDVHPDHGYRIIDYKTTDNPEAPAKTHLGTPKEGRESIQLMIKGKSRQWTNLQLPLYRWLAAGDSRIDPARPLQVAYFNLPKAVQDTRIEYWPDEAALAAEAETCLESVVRFIQAGVWHPTSKSSMYDDFKPLLHHGTDWVPNA